MRWALVLVLLLTVGLVACGGDSDSGDEPTTTAAAGDPTATEPQAADPAATETRAAEQTEVAEARSDAQATVTTQVNRPDGGSATATAPRATATASVAATATTAPAADTATPVPAEPNDERLAEALLTLDDVPAGWVITPNEEDDEENICNVPSFSDEYPDAPKATVDMQGGDLGPLLSHGIFYVGEDAADETMDTVRGIFASCTTWEATDDDGSTTTATISEMSFPDVGDDRFALRAVVTSGDFELAVDVVYLRLGGYLIGISHAALSDVDSEQTVEYVERAIEKASQLQGS